MHSFVRLYFSTEKFNKTILPTVSQPGFFNLTSTFRSDSDFPIPYFYTERRNSPCDKCPPNSSLLATKNKFMIWIVSHCYTQSKREYYMKELAKYIPVDIFGKCGNRTKCDSWRKDCTRDMMKDYKFYFAAENAICKEYFTGNKSLIVWNYPTFIFGFSKISFKQECIPVGCVPSAAVAVSWGGSAKRGLSAGVCLGGCLHRSCRPGGVYKSPLWTESQTVVKTVSSTTVADGN